MDKKAKKICVKIGDIISILVRCCLIVNDPDNLSTIKKYNFFGIIQRNCINIT